MSAARFSSSVDPSAAVVEFHVYADPVGAVFERACKREHNARQCVAGLQRQGFRPLLRACLVDAAGTSWTEIVPLE